MTCTFISSLGWNKFKCYHSQAKKLPANIPKNRSATWPSAILSYPVKTTARIDSFNQSLKQGVPALENKSTKLFHIVHWALRAHVSILLDWRFPIKLWIESVPKKLGSLRASKDSPSSSSNPAVAISYQLNQCGPMVYVDSLYQKDLPSHCPSFLFENHMWPQASLLILSHPSHQMT